MFNTLAFISLLTILTLTEPAKHHGKCPHDCDCMETTNAFLEGGVYRIAECGKRNISKFPSFLKYKGLRYEEVELGQNGLHSIPARAFNGITVTVLNASHNGKLNIHEDAFEGAVGVKEVHLSYCGLTSSPNAFVHLKDLRRLDLSHNKITHLTTKAFSTLTKLWWLNLSHNPTLRFETNFAAFDKLVVLGYMDLSHCNLPDVPVGALQSLQNLTTLQVNNNQIKEIPEKAFDGVQRLQELDLGHNAITFKPSARIFRGLFHLRKLKLSHCNMPSFDKSFFKDLVSLETFVIRRCKIMKMPQHPFEDLRYIKYLDISHNLFDLNAEIFTSTVETMETLRLDGMNLTEFPRHFIGSMRNLKKLTLNENSIPLPKGVFRSLPKHLEIHLKSNNIQTENISADVFEGARRPIGLYIQDNNITTLDFLTGDPCKFYDVSLDLSHNPVFCDCDVYRMIQKKIFYLVGDCDAPVKYHSKKLLYIPYLRKPVKYLEKEAFEDCKGFDRTGDRYECTCKSWMNFEKPEKCSGCDVRACAVALVILSVAISLFS